MRHTLTYALLIAAPTLAIAQVPPTPPTPPEPPKARVAPVPKVRVEPRIGVEPYVKIEPFDFEHFRLEDLQWKHQFELQSKMDELRWHAEDLKSQVEAGTLLSRQLAQAAREEALQQAQQARELALQQSQLAREQTLQQSQLARQFALGAGHESFLEARPRPAWAREDPADSIYRLAREAINRGEYRRAAQLFNEVTTKFPKSQYALDCAYWEAFARYRVGTTDDLRAALRILEEWKTQFAALRPNESSIDVAGLRARIQGALAARGDAQAARALQAEAAQSAGCDREEISVRAEALSALGQMDVAAAMPVVRKVLARRDDCTVELRRRALYVVGRQQSSDEAVRVMLDVARNDTDAGIRGEAMGWLSRVAGDQAVPMLEDLLRTSAEERTQRSAINALGSIDSERARRALRAIIERDDASQNVRSEAILSLTRERDGRLVANDDQVYLRGLYAKLDNPRLRESVLSAVSRIDTPDNVRFLVGIGRNQSEAPSLRAAALQRLGRMPSATFADIAGLYEVADSRSMREQIINALGQRKEPEAIDKLVEVAKKDTDYNIRRYAIQILSRSNNPRAMDAIKELAEPRP